MKCPRCRACVSPSENGCHTCGFSAALLHGYLGNQWVKLERITDAAHCLRLEDARKTEVVLDDFERSFPQAFFAVYLGVLPKQLSVTELGFWLLNQGAFNTHSVSRRNDFGIVLVVDPVEMTASITLGYAIEEFFGDNIVTRILQSAAVHLRRGAIGPAIDSTCTQCADVLRKRAQTIRWQPGDSNLQSAASDLGLQPLRGGHKNSSRPLAGSTTLSKP